jgi:hypothetical protein
MDLQLKDKVVLITGEPKGSAGPSAELCQRRHCRICG